MLFHLVLYLLHVFFVGDVNRFMDAVCEADSLLFLVEDGVVVLEEVYAEFPLVTTEDVHLALGCALLDVGLFRQEVDRVADDVFQVGKFGVLFISAVACVGLPVLAECTRNSTG